MVEKVKINPNGERVKIEISFTGLIVASYEYLLWEAQSNTVLETHQGNNQNPHDDDYLLPMPLANNIGRIIDVRTRFVGLDPDDLKKYEVKVEIFQPNSIRQVIDSGIVNGKSQFSQIYITIE
ncbi:MAG: hypothetical protein HXX16_16235 [Bacteroidales bacterium]|nr:hypothetical protein [Bacteroidales bacterium]